MAATVQPPLPVADPQPYEVRVRRSLGGSITVIGHDSHGEPIAEFRIPEEHMCERVVRHMEKWCRWVDGSGPLHVVS
jgi:hypothetical protein